MGHTGGDAMVVVIFDIDVQTIFDDVRMILDDGVPMNPVDCVRAIGFGDGLPSLVGVVLMILFFGAQILVVDYLK